MIVELDSLRRTGLCRLGAVLWINEFIEFMSLKPKLPGHVASRPRSGIWHSRMEDVMTAPHFLDFAKGFVPLASEYFGEPAHLWSLNAFHADENTPFIPSLHRLHRDREADRILVLFVALTNIDIEGAQLLVPSDGRWLSNQWEAVWGFRGTAWLADTTRLHCGLLSGGPRSIAWARFANCIPQAKHDEGLPDIV